MPRPAERGSPTEREAAAELGQTMLIGEVSAVTGLTQRTLRYYEEIGLLPPATPVSYTHLTLPTIYSV